MPCNNFWLNGESLHDLGDDHLINARAWLNRNRDRLLSAGEYVSSWGDLEPVPSMYSDEDLDDLAEAMDEELKRRFLVL